MLNAFTGESKTDAERIFEWQPVAKRLGLPQFPSNASLPWVGPPLPVIQHLSHLHSWMDHQTFFKHVDETHAGFFPSCLSSIQIGNTPLYRHGTIGLHTLWSAKHVWSYVFFLCFDLPSKCSLTPVIGLFVCRKANPRQLSLFLSLLCESFKMMCGR